MPFIIHFMVLDFFHCSGSNMKVSMTLVCDGYYDCDNYEDESSCSKYWNSSFVFILILCLTASHCSDALMFHCLLPNT